MKTWEGEARLDVDEKILKIHKIIKMLKIALYCCLTSGILFIWLQMNYSDITCKLSEFIVHFRKMCKKILDLKI